MAEQSSKVLVEGNLSYSSPSHLLPAGGDCSNPITPTAEVDSSVHASRPEKGNPWEHIPSTSTALSDTRSVAEEDTSTRKEVEKFEFEPWPHAS